MYLIIGQHFRYQMAELRTDAHFLGWVHDEGIHVVRFRDGRFERMRVYSEPASYNPRLLRWVHDWIEYQMEDKG